MRKVLFFILVPLFFVGTSNAIGQQNQPDLTDSVAFHDFLIKQNEVPGLSVRFILENKILTDSIPAASLFGFTELTSGGLVSSAFSQLNQFTKLRDTLKLLNPKWEFLIFSQPSSLTASQEYVANLLRNGDIQIVGQSNLSSNDLILLASKLPYKPLAQYKFQVISDYKLFVVTVIIVFFFVMALLMILFMLVFKAKKNKREQLTKDYEFLIVGPLTNLLFEKELDEIKKLSDAEINDIFPATLLSKALFQHVLIDKIIGLNKKMKGDFKNKLKALYQRLELNKVSLGNLKSKQWDRVATGLVQINEMDLIEALSEVKKFTNSPNFYVRSQAVGTLLNLSDKMDLVFLKDQTYPLSAWQQMNYLRIIKFLYQSKELHMKSLFESENQSVRLFGYKLVRLIGLVDFLEDLGKLAPNASDEEKIEIIKTYEVLGAHMQADFVNDCLLSENPKLQQAAAQAIGEIGNKESVTILENLLKSQPEFRLKMILLKSLQNLDSNQFEKFTSIQMDFDTQRIKRHLLDPLLRHV